jgi:hypothetical protein
MPAKAALWIASAFARCAPADKSRSLSSGAHSRESLARNDELPFSDATN